MSKTLVAYFSASGVTAKLAKNLAEAAGARPL
jgi:flavodoxin